MEIEKPIFIIGPGRSGSTIFHEIFAEHPNVAWLSNILKKYPQKIISNKRIMHLIDIPIMKNIIKWKISPFECYNFWDIYYKGFSTPCRDLIREDVTIKSKKNITNALSNILTSKRNRLLIKITGWSRIGFLHEIFPDAKFIHIVRNCGAFVNSMMNVNWWLGWRGPNNWRWGELSSKQKKKWLEYNQSFTSLAAIEWNILMQAVDDASSKLSPDNFLEIRYEDLCQNPVKTYKKTIEFTELQWSDYYEKKIKSFKLKNTNYKWQNELTDNQKKEIKEVSKYYLEKYNYI